MNENRIWIRPQFDNCLRWLNDVAPKQAEFAMMKTLNRAAYEGSKEVQREMAAVFDRPTPWVLNAVRYIKATRGNLVARIDLDRRGNKAGVAVHQVLQAEIHGGQRNLKRAEVALAKMGVLPAGMAIVPGAAAQLDAHGNMRAAQLVQIMAWFNAFGEQGYSANMKDAGRAKLAKGNRKQGRYGFEYFALQRPRGKLRPGIYQRFTTSFGSAVKPVVIFIKQPSYKPRFDFHKVGLDAAMRVINRDLKNEVADAVRTAR